MGASATSPLIVEGDTDTSTACKGKKKRSAVWDDFDDVTVNGVQKIKCNHCKGLFSKIPGGSTAHLIRHLKTCPKKARLSPPGQQMLSFTRLEGDDSQGIVSTYKFDKEKLNEWFARLVILEEKPFRMIESKGFRAFCQFLNPRAENVSRITVQRESMKMYAKEKMKLKEVLASVSRIALTSDLWTASNQRKGYISLTAHYVDKDWKLCKRILNFKHLPPPHTGLLISDCIYSCLEGWGIEKKISAITLDNASANDSVISCLRNQFRATGNLFFEGKIFQVRCCAHIVNLIVQEGLKAIDNTIDNIRESVKYISGSPSRLSVWNDIIQRLNVPSKKTLKLDVCIRWNSTYEMLDAAMELPFAFPEYAARDRTYSWLPSTDDWAKAQQVHAFLQVFYDCTKIFSGNQYPTANLFLPSLWKIKDALQKNASAGPDFIRQMTVGMKMKFDKYWDECHLLMSLAVVLDPRCNMGLVSFIFMKLYPTERAAAETSKVRQALEDLYKSYVNTLPAAGVEESRDADISVPGNPDVLNEYISYLAQARMGVDTKESELEMYLKEPIVVRAEFDVLEWWKMRVSESKYPTLSVMARDILSIPISTVASESAFSTGSRVVSKYRSSLSPNTVEALICTQDWLRPIWGGDMSDDDEEEEIEIHDESLPTDQ